MTATAANTAAAETETSAKRIEANRRNAQRSTGPRSAEGKARVRLNALKHGLTAATVVLPGEDPRLLQARVQDWKDDHRPESAMEDYLVERAAHLSWQLDRADRTIAARLTELMRFDHIDQAAAEADDVADLARRLFWDPYGPLPLYPHSQGLRPTPRISWPDAVEDLLNPARILNQLEGTVGGCQWLLDRWGDLRGLLERGLNWQGPDRLKAIQLLGRQPMDAPDDDRVLMIYLASNAMDPGGKLTFADMNCEMSDYEQKKFSERVEGRQGRAMTPGSPEAARSALLDLVSHAVTRLEVLQGLHRQRRALERERLDHLAFDDSDEGERLRRYQLATGRALLRTISTIYKVRKEHLAAAGSESSVAAVSRAVFDMLFGSECIDPTFGTIGGLAVDPLAALPASAYGIDETKPMPTGEGYGSVESPSRTGAGSVGWAFQPDSEAFCQAGSVGWAFRPDAEALRQAGQPDLRENEAAPWVAATFPPESPLADSDETKPIDETKPTGAEGPSATTADDRRPETGRTDGVASRSPSGPPVPSVLLDVLRVLRGPHSLANWSSLTAGEERSGAGS